MSSATATRIRTLSAPQLPMRWLKRQLGVNAVAARAGALNPETQYVLNYFGMEEPVLIEDMYPRLKDVELIAVPMLNGETKLREVSHLFTDYGVRCMPVGTPENIEGVVTVTDLAKCSIKSFAHRKTKPARLITASCWTHRLKT